MTKAIFSDLFKAEEFLENSDHRFGCCQGSAMREKNINTQIYKTVNKEKITAMELMGF